MTTSHTKKNISISSYCDSNIFGNGNSGDTLYSFINSFNKEEEFTKSDIICLQNVNKIEINKLNQLGFPFIKIGCLEDNDKCNVILSKFAILDSITVSLIPDAYPNLTPKIMLIVSIRYDNFIFYVINIQLDQNLEFLRMLQISIVMNKLSYFRNNNIPHIIVGNFNALTATDYSLNELSMIRSSRKKTHDEDIKFLVTKYISGFNYYDSINLFDFNTHIRNAKLQHTITKKNNSALNTSHSVNNSDHNSEYVSLKYSRFNYFYFSSSFIPFFNNLFYNSASNCIFISFNLLI